MPPESGKENAVFRFYAELNDLLPSSPGQTTERIHDFEGKPSVKDAMEAQGVPHTEVDLIIANGRAVGFDYPLHAGDRIAVYPVFESFDITPLVRLREAPLREVRFVLDVHLGKLARWLRLLGFDTVYRNDFADVEIAALSTEERRIVLTRDRHLLHRKTIDHGYWVRAVAPDAQILEVLRRFQLEGSIRRFARCLECNGQIHRVDKEAVWERLEPKTRLYYEKFYQCAECGRVYWEGSHYERIVAKLERLLGDRSNT